MVYTYLIFFKITKSNFEPTVLDTDKLDEGFKYDIIIILTSNFYTPTLNNTIHKYVSVINESSCTVIKNTLSKTIFPPKGFTDIGNQKYVL